MLIDGTCAGDDLAGTIARFFDTIRRGVETTTFNVLIKMDLTLTQLRVIMALVQSDRPQPIFEIAEALDLSLATAGRAVDRLVREGIADRREDPGDRRSKLVSLTTRGRELGEIQRDSVLRHIRRFTASLPACTADNLCQALRAALAATESTSPAPAA